MKTTISELRGAVAYWASSSYTATADDPCCGHSADIAEAVYDALEDAWDGESALVEVEGRRFLLYLDE